MCKIWIPEEIWLQIIDYLDTETFYNITIAFKREYPTFVNSIFRTICFRIIKKHTRVRLMNHLYSSLDDAYFNKCENYLMFKSMFNNTTSLDKEPILSFNFKQCTYITQIAKNYRDYVIAILKEKGNKKNENLFSNLTKINTSDLFFTKQEHRDKLVFKYKNITIKIEDVFNYTYNQNRKEYQELVQLQCQSNCRQGVLLTRRHQALNQQ